MPEQIDYNNRRFRPVEPERGDLVGYYHQEGDLVWAEFGGGPVVQGRLVGTRRADGSVEFAYCQLLAGGQFVAGRCHSTPTFRDDGRMVLKEHFERMNGDSGVSWIEEIK